MAFITQTQRMEMILAHSAGMDLPQIVSEEIREFMRSEPYLRMVEAEAYYRNRSDVQKKTNPYAQRSNTKIEHPLLRRLIAQKTDYLLSRPFSIDTESETYAGALNDIFDDTFRRKWKSFGRSSIKSGIAWLQPYIDHDGRFRVMRIPATQVVPLWDDLEEENLSGFIRFYPQIVYEGRMKKTIWRAELWDTNGVQYFVSQDGSDFLHDSERQAQSHLMIDKKPFNWERPPIIWVRYNEEALPLYYFLKELIDDVNWQTSITADVLRDIAKFIFVLRNYSGEDLQEFVKDLKESLAIKVDSDGGVDKLQPELDIDAVMQFLDKQRRDVYDYGAGVDTKDPELGNASGKAIGFRYMDLNNDCSNLGGELKAAMEQLKFFIDRYLIVKGKGDFTSETFTVTFNADMPVDETEIISNCATSASLISQKTMLTNHPWVEDVEAEIEQMEQERENEIQALESFNFPAEQGGEVNEPAE